MSGKGQFPDRFKGVTVLARRFEESPFLDRYDGPDLVRGVYAGRFFPISFGDDPVEKYWTLRRKSLLFDVPEKPVEISGPDATAFLEHVLARRIETLEVGRGRYALALTPGGGIFMDGLVFRLGPDRFWYVQADGEFERWLIAHSGGFDVAISDPQSRVLQIQGPTAIEVMKAATAGAIDEGMKYFRAGIFDLGGQRLYVSRTGWTNELGFEVYTNNETDHLALWDHLVESGAPHGMEVSDTLAMNMRRIEGGILDNGADIDVTMTPFEAGLGSFVDMDKGDFIGRAALIDADRRTLLFGLTCQTCVPESGCDVLSDGDVVGRMASCAASPTLGRGIGYVRFSRRGDWVGAAVELRLPDGSLHKADVVTLPFFDQGKNIVRGLDREVPPRPT